MTTDLFAQINNAVLDLQRSQLQTFERPLKKIASLLRHQDLKEANSKLTANVDLDTFLARSEKTDGGMIGSHALAWPDDSEEALGLTILLIEKLAADPGFAKSFGHHYFYSSNKIISGIHSLTSQLIIPFIRDYKTYIETHGNITPKLRLPQSKRIFIVHGHDEGARETVARFLERLGFEPIILHEQANRGRTVMEKVELNSDVGFAVVLLTPDDEGCPKGGTPAPRVRQNVLLELGYFLGLLGREKVCALKRGSVEIPSDFAGVVWESMDGNGWQLALARELKAVGHEVDLNKVY